MYSDPDHERIELELEAGFRVQDGKDTMLRFEGVLLKPRIRLPRVKRGSDHVGAAADKTRQSVRFDIKLIVELTETALSRGSVYYPE
jgi:hypothetical protein